MGIKEALKLLDELNIMTLYDGDSICHSEFAEPLRMAISALEKQEGQRLSVNMIEVFDYNEGYCEKPEYHCSTCGRIIVKKHNYYPKCGQHIDWSE